MFKTNFLSTTKSGRLKKDLGGNFPQMSPVSAAWAELSPESLPLGTFTFVQGD